MSKSERFFDRDTKHLQILGDHWLRPGRLANAKGKGGREEMSGAVWQLDVGAECNRLLGYAEACEVGSMGFGETAQLAKDIRSIVNRVAEFEELSHE